MVILGNIVLGVAAVLKTVLTAYTVIIVISWLLSWVRPDPYHPVVRFLRALTEPVFWRVRKTLPFTYINGLDLSPAVVLLVVMFLQYAVVENLFWLAGKLKSGVWL